MLQPRPTSLDRILQARAMRYQWFVFALARLAGKLTRLGSELVARQQPARLGASR